MQNTDVNGIAEVRDRKVKRRVEKEKRNKCVSVWAGITTAIGEAGHIHSH